MPTSTGSSRENARSHLLILLAVAVQLVPLAVSADLIDPDEGLHAAIAREMVTSGDWVVPRILGTDFLDKPVLFFWALATSLATFGNTEFAVRLPGVLFGLAGTFTTALLAHAVLGPRAFAPTAVVMATLAAPFAMLLAPVHDVALVPFTTMALWAFWRRAHDDAPWGLVVLAGLALGLAMLTKGLAGVALAGLAWGSYLLLTRTLSVRRIGDGAAALAIAALVAAPWYVAVEERAPGYLHYFFVERHLMGFTTSTQNHGAQPWWFYLPIVTIGSLPWVGWLLASVSRVRVTPFGGAARARLFATSWLASNLLFLSAAGSKLLTYVLPAFPAIALLVVTAWHEDEEGVASSRVGAWVEGVSAVLLPVAAVALAAQDASVSMTRIVSMCVWSGVCGALWLAAQRARQTLLPRALVAALTCMGVSLALYGPVAAAHSAKALAIHFNASGRLPRRLLVFDERLGSLVFYLSPALRGEVDEARLVAVDFGELRQSARSVAAGDVVAIPTRALPLVSRSLPTDQLPFVEVGDRYRLYSAPELLQGR